MSLQIGDEVKWNWASGTAFGKITHRIESDVTRVIKETEVTRHASADEPAFLIEQDDGSEVLKSITEIEKV